MQAVSALKEKPALEVDILLSSSLGTWVNIWPVTG